MKKLMTIFVFLGLAPIAFAHETETKKALLEIDTIAGDYVANGSSEVVELKQKPFNLKQQIKIIEKDVKGFSDCEMVTVVGRRNNIKDLSDKSILDDTKIADKLKALYKKGQIKAIISRQWDGASGDGEYCSVWEFRVFSKDNHVLLMHFDVTD